jgi:hypothetical protein
MAVSTVAICDLCDLFREFSMQPQLVREAMCANASQVLSGVCQLSHGCTCDKQKQHFPSCDHHHDCVESRGQSMLQVQRNKRNDHHLWQISRGEIMELNVDMEFAQTL